MCVCVCVCGNQAVVVNEAHKVVPQNQLGKKLESCKDKKETFVIPY